MSAFEKEREICQKAEQELFETNKRLVALQQLCDELARVLEDWEKMSPSGQDDWVFRRRDVLDKYEKLTETTKTGEL